jgi:hypothetical protein
MSDTGLDQAHSPAVQFKVHQHRHRFAVRSDFKSAAGDLLAAHEFALSAIVQCLGRFAGKKWKSDLAFEIRQKIEQVSQLSALFLQGVDPSEVAISEGLYGQAATLLRQRMEILGAIDEVWLGKRNPRSTPKITSLPSELRRQYVILSELSHAAVPDYLSQIHTSTRGELVGTSLTPTFDKDVSIFLYRIELILLFEFSHRQEAAIKAAYEGEGFTSEEVRLLQAAISAARSAIEKLI